MEHHFRYDIHNRMLNVPVESGARAMGVGHEQQCDLSSESWPDGPAVASRMPMKS